MTSPPDATPTWIEAWTDAQRRLWESWLSLARPVSATPQPGAAAGWSEGLELWRRMVMPSAEPAAADVGRRLVEQWMAYLRWGESLVPGTTAQPAAAPAATDWMAAFGRMFAPGGGSGTPFGGGGETDVMRGLSAFWGLPMDMGRRVLASLSAFPGDALAMAKEAAAPHDVAGMARAPLERFLAIPPLGYAREHQERGQTAMQDWLAYQRAAGAFMAVMTRIATRTTEVIQRRFAERAVSGQPLESLRQTYDLFVDCAEEAYAEVVTAADFGKVSADLMNAAMAVKRHVQDMSEEMASAANLPTRRELDTSHRQLQDVKRQVQAMRDATRHAATAPAETTSALAALEREVQALRGEVAELRAGAAPAPARAGAAGAKGRQSRTQKVEG